MDALPGFLSTNEDWLMQRVLEYAKRFGFTKYTSTLQEAWRLSISGLTASLCDAARSYRAVPELQPDDDYTRDSLAQFGLLEARRHRQRGTTLAMFLGLMKYYRQAYLDLLTAKPLGTGEPYRLFIERCFDRIEIAFCQEWAGIEPRQLSSELESANRSITNEKNSYLTVFESLSDPVLMLDAQDTLVNLNQAASLLVDPAHVPGGHYYQAMALGVGPQSHGKHPIDKICVGRPVAEVLPWLVPTLRALREKPGESAECEAVLTTGRAHFEVTRSAMLDISEKFTSSIVILRNTTRAVLAQAELKKTIADLGQALSEVKTLSGLLPICASCKNVRDDKGYWQQVERYLTDHTGATFSHAICPECIRKLYPDIAEKVIASGSKPAGS